MNRSGTFLSHLSWVIVTSQLFLHKPSLYKPPVTNIPYFFSISSGTILAYFFFTGVEGKS
jgi:hypothetical protein